jgi:hypothetical protein
MPNTRKPRESPAMPSEVLAAHPDSVENIWKIYTRPSGGIKDFFFGTFKVLFNK